MEPLAPPGTDDVAGRPRFRWRYIWWHTWPPTPTRQDLRDFYFSSLLAVAATLLIGAVGLVAYTWGRWWVWPLAWRRLDVLVIAGTVVIVAYYAFVYWDWQRKRAA